MDLVWKFLKQGAFVIIGSIVFPIFLILLFDLGFFKVTLLTFLFALAAGSYLTISTIKGVVSRFKPTATQSYLNENMKSAKRDMRIIKGAIYEIPSKNQQPFIELYQSMKNVMNVVNEHPQKYTQARVFFNELLPNSKTIIERYAYLKNQPIHNNEIKETLHNTDKSIHDIKKQVDEELLMLLKDDADRLHLDVTYLNPTKPKDGNPPV